MANLVIGFSLLMNVALSFCFGCSYTMTHPQEVREMIQVIDNIF